MFCVSLECAHTYVKFGENYFILFWSYRHFYIQEEKKLLTANFVCSFVPLTIKILAIGHWSIAGTLCFQISYGGFVSIGVMVSQILANVFLSAKMQSCRNHKAMI